MTMPLGLAQVSSEMDEENLGWSPSSKRSPPVTVRPMTMGDGRNHHLGVASGGYMYVAIRI